MQSHLFTTGLHRIALSAYVVTLLAGFMPSSYAQEMRVLPTLHIEAGKTFEIIGDNAEGTYSWLLQKDQTFIEAGRERAFHVRIPEAGKYTLDGAVDFPNGDRKNLTMTLDVVPPTTATNISDADVTTRPPHTNGRVTLPENLPVLAIVPKQSRDGIVTADVDANKDTNNDGDTTNDRDTANTLFETDKNTLYVWFTVTNTPTIAVTTTGGVHTFTVTFGPATTTADIETTRPTPITGTITVTPWDSGQIGFVFAVPDAPQDIVHQWDFGDGTQSLQTEPVHKYERNGSYAVQVSVRSLRDGSVTAEGKTTVDVNTVSEGTVSSAAGISSSSAETNTPPTDQPIEERPTTFTLILQIIGVAAMAIVIGAIGTWLLVRFASRRGSLQQTLEDAEARMLGKGKIPGSSIDVPAPPMELKREENLAAGDKIEEDLFADDVKEEKKPNPPVPPKPQQKEPEVIQATAEAPAWLQQGLAAANTKPANVSANFGEEAGVKPNTSPELSKEEVPPWLQQPTQGPEASAEKPANTAQVATAAETKSPEPSGPTELFSKGKTSVNMPGVQMTEEKPLPPPPPVGVPVAPVSEVKTEAAVPSALAPTEQKTESTPPTSPVPEIASAPIPTPELKSTTPEPITSAAPAPASTPIVQAPVSAAPDAKKTMTPEEEEERKKKEQERKKKKRQRYRENVKKRKQEEKAAPAITPDAPVPNAAPSVTTTTTTTTVSAPNPTPAAPEAKPAVAAPVLPSTPTPVITVGDAPVESPPSTPDDLEKELSAVIDQVKPTEGQVGKAMPANQTTEPPQATTQGDDKIAFMIRADNINPATGEAQNPTQNQE
jgi:hypothetical protein